MSRTYAELISLVRDWSNRDIEVLPNRIIADCVRYAADKAYRTLRVVPLEHTVVYDLAALRSATSSSNNRFASVTELAIPADLIEFIMIRGIDSAGRTTRIFNEKTDVRTFNDLYADRYSDLASWTRQGDCVLLTPGIGNSGTNFGSTGTTNEAGIEFYYYRRLPALYARYDATAANANFGLTTEVTEMTPLPTPTPDTPDMIPTGFLTFTTDDNGNRTYSDAMEGDAGAVQVYGNTVSNWLKDENERVLLMGALSEVFFYLQEDDQAQKYAALFTQEIQELNDEDQMRHVSGGNVQVHFNGRGLI